MQDSDTGETHGTDYPPQHVLKGHRGTRESVRLRHPLSSLQNLIIQSILGPEAEIFHLLFLVLL